MICVRIHALRLDGSVRGGRHVSAAPDEVSRVPNSLFPRSDCWSCLGARLGHQVLDEQVWFTTSHAPAFPTAPTGLGTIAMPGRANDMS